MHEFDHLISAKRRSTASQRLALIGVVFVMLAGCGLVMDADDRIERAESAMAEGDFLAASLDLKKALQESPRSAKARLLLGRSFLRLNDAASAESELKRAAEYGVPAVELNSDLASAYWQQRKLESLLSEPLLVDDLSDADRANIRFMRGNAHLATGSPDVARRDFETALSLEPDNILLQLALIESHSANGDLDKARGELDKLIETLPNNPGVRNASGDFYLAAAPARLEEAAAEYGRAIELTNAGGNRAVRLKAFSGKAGAELQMGNTDAAEVAVLAYREIAAEEVYGMVMEAQLRLAQERVEPAVALLQTALRLEPGHAGANLLMGMSQARLGKLGQAEAYVASAVAADPSNVTARTMLARIRGDLRKTDGAVAVLEPLLDLDDANALAVAADLRLAAGETDEGLDFLRRRLAGDPDNATLALDLAGALLAAGRTDEARELVNGLGNFSADESVRAGVLSAMTSAAEGDDAASLAEAERLVAANPDNADLSVFVGRLYAGQGNVAAARTAFERSIEIAPGRYTAYANLANLLVTDGDRASAITVLEQAASRIDTPVLALRGLAELKLQNGDSEGAEADLRKAISTDANYPAAKLLLGQILAQNGNNAEAMTAFSDYIELVPGDARGYYFAGLLSLQDRKTEDALIALKKANELNPSNAGTILNLSRAHLASDQRAEAMRVLQSGYDAGVRHPAVVANLATMMASGGDLGRALGIVDTLEVSTEKAAVVDLVKGDLYMQSKQYPSASRRYRSAFSTTADWRMAAKQMIAGHEAGERDADKLLGNFVATNPSNAAARETLAQLLDEQGKDAAAVVQYRAILDDDPENFTVLNNLAYLLAEQGNPDAVALAEKALAIQPGNPSVLDTMGWAQVRAGNAPDGLETLRRAAELAPDNGDIAFHMATALSEIGDNDAAISILNRALGQNKPFASRSEAQALLQGLRK
ncbi:MAG: XrtA/PEP-CTERM system TPR-repeat protein PrsT [Woeseiaceae bacterium]